MRRVGFAALLVVLWILAWGQLTLANLLSGLVVTVGLLLAFPRRRPTASELRYSAAGIARLAAYIARQLITSNVVMTRQILRRNTAHRSSVLAHRLGRPSEEVATVMSSIIALSPGTMTVDVARDSSIIYVHFFDLRDVTAARAGLDHLEERVVAAVAGPPELAPSADPQPPDQETP